MNETPPPATELDRLIVQARANLDARLLDHQSPTPRAGDDRVHSLTWTEWVEWIQWVEWVQR